MNDEQFKKMQRTVASALGKLSHQKSPRPKEYYQAIQKKSAAKRKQNRLSTPTVVE